jgi:hypothetical protein
VGGEAPDAKRVEHRPPDGGWARRQGPAARAASPAAPRSDSERKKTLSGGITEVVTALSGSCNGARQAHSDHVPSMYQYGMMLDDCGKHQAAEILCARRLARLPI